MITVNTELKYNTGNHLSFINKTHENRSFQFNVFSTINFTLGIFSTP